MNTKSDEQAQAKAWADEILAWFVSGILWVDASRTERETLTDPDDTKPEPLTVTVRGDWHTPGSIDPTPVEYSILLTTGGPAVRITGILHNGVPENAVLQCQNWYTPWEEVKVTIDQYDALVAYASTFYFGE